ncbi:MAG: putative bifunctional diguanylate cyclase/phosphodiesterase [Halochromatium sp.]
MITSNTILVADDESADLAVLVDLLEPDYRVRVAQSGQQALRAATREPRPDLILLDIQMPDLSGYQVLEALHAQATTRDIPVIFITARTATEDEERGLELGAADFIVKPIQPGVLRARVRTQLENKAARDLLKDRNDWLKRDLLRAQQAGRIGSWKVDLNTDHLEWSPQTYHLFGLEPDAPLGFATCIEVVYAEDRERVKTAWEAARAGEPYDIEFRTANSEGQTWLRSIAEFVDDDAGKPTIALGTIQDITDKKHHEQQLEALAFSDPLTGLPNRYAFDQRADQRLQQMVDGPYETRVYQIDLDGLGQINASLGETAGDAVLRIIGQRLQAFAGDIGQVARLSGDHFALAMYECTGEECVVEQVEAIKQVIKQPVKLGNDSLWVSACIGAVHNTGNLFRQVGPLLRMADQAMYQAKMAGKGQHAQFYLSQYQSDCSLQVRLDEIRQALRARDFRLYYQPKVDLLNGDLIGLEALTRWQHPERGVLGPGEFIPHLEGHPLMVDLGDWVIDTALAQLLAWQQAGLTTTVSVNVASNQLQHPAFVDKLAACLAAYPSLDAGRFAIDPAHFELEVLESGPMLDLNRSIEIFKRLREIGVTISLDDFGTGHSSLQTLHALSPTILKIDRSFVLGMLSDSRCQSIVKAILELGRSFGLKVVAEGLETPTHGEALIDLGCRYAQGYGIARPMPAEQVTDWLAQWREQKPEWIGMRDGTASD